MSSFLRLFMAYDLRGVPAFVENWFNQVLDLLLPFPIIVDPGQSWAFAIFSPIRYSTASIHLFAITTLLLL
jgi:hypothetical protein